MGSHLDKHMQKMEETVNALKQNRIFEGDERKKPPVEASLMSKFHFFYGDYTFTRVFTATHSIGRMEVNW